MGADGSIGVMVGRFPRRAAPDFLLRVLGGGCRSTTVWMSDYPDPRRRGGEPSHRFDDPDPQALVATAMDIWRRRGTAYISFYKCPWSDRAWDDIQRHADVFGSWAPCSPIIVLGRHRKDIGLEDFDSRRVNAAASVCFWGRGWVQDYHAAVEAFRRFEPYREMLDAVSVLGGQTTEIAFWG